MPKSHKLLSRKPKAFVLSVYALILFGFLLVGFLAGLVWGDLFNASGPEVSPTPTPNKDAKVTTTNTPLPDANGVLCTADAKQCPNGTWVGRSGPKCDFVCPN